MNNYIIETAAEYLQAFYEQGYQGAARTELYARQCARTTKV